MKALITGGAGFIGAHVTKHVIDLGMEAVVLDDLSGGFDLPGGKEDPRFNGAGVFARKNSLFV